MKFTRHTFKVSIIWMLLPYLVFLKTDFAQSQAKLPGIKEKTAAMQEHKGFFNFYWEEGTGKVYLEISKLGDEFLYVSSLPAGLGSNDIGLDRGQLGKRAIVRFEKIGPKVLMIQPNYDYRASTDNPAESAAIEQAFAQSVLGGFDVVAEEGGNTLIEITPFLISDVHGVAGTLRRSSQGSYSLDKSRSALYLPRTKSFPKNTEFEVTVTFTGEPGGAFVRSVTPSPEAITLRVHHSFVELPDANYKPRKFDPRAGYFATSYMDFGVPISENIMQRVINRHRLEKKDPGAEKSEAIKPIVYYLDSGTPEPIRSALLDGAKWWNEAFEAAGFINAFQVEMMPEDADPMDVRYNMIQWVHRSTRGWSYGASVTDPRTGEIIKGHVTLGSLRVRQDFLIAEALLSPYAEDEEPTKEMEEMALARLRQLSAHEIGHTIGLAHNYIASAQGNASVMDYPHPQVQIMGARKLSLVNAYDQKIGEWDKVAIKWGYTQFAERANEEEELNKIIEDALDKGLSFLSDQDARPVGSAHPKTHLWDNGTNASAELDRIMNVRRIALLNFGENSIRKGTPLASLEESLVPVYFLHRYQTEAAVKIIGGLEYTYAIKGDGQIPTAMVSGKEQKEAIDAVLRTLDPVELMLPERIVSLVPPKPIGFSRNRESFPSRNGVTFDPLMAAEAAISMTLDLLLHPERANRMVELNARNADNPSFFDLSNLLLRNHMQIPLEAAFRGELRRISNHLMLKKFMELSQDPRALPAVREQALMTIDDYELWLSRRISIPRNPTLGHYNYMRDLIKRYREQNTELKLPNPVSPPPGAPIGMDIIDYCNWWEDQN
jgi:hypothetical protein